MIWEGIKSLKVLKHSSHTNVVRYRCILIKRYFDIYAPVDLMKSIFSNTLPDQITAVIGNHSPIAGNFGFVTIPSNPRTFENVMVYEYLQTMANSVRYETKYNTKSYSLYVPHEFFDGTEHPRRVFLQILP